MHSNDCKGKVLICVHNLCFGLRITCSGAVNVYSVRAFLAFNVCGLVDAPLEVKITI